jgi:hypothetical protein
MRDVNQHVLILGDSNTVLLGELGIMLRKDAGMENHWKGLGKRIPW